MDNYKNPEKIPSSVCVCVGGGGFAGVGGGAGGSTKGGSQKFFSTFKVRQTL